MWDSSFILKSWGVLGGWVVAYSILVSAPVPFDFRSYSDLVGIGPRGLGLRVWGQSLTMIFFGLPLYLFYSPSIEVTVEDTLNVLDL